MNNKRPNFFNGQFLKADDFNLDQAYHISALREHNRTQHTWGIAEGLEVSFQAGSLKANITGGTAIDADGKIIYLSASGYTIDFSTITTNELTFYITIEHAETTTESTSETGITGDTRIDEIPLIEASPALPGDPARKLILAQVTLVVNTGTGDTNGTRSIESVDPALRRYAGIIAGDLEARSLSLSIDEADKSLWPNLKGTKVGNETKLDVTIGQTDFSGQLKVDGAVGIGVEPSTVAKLQVGGALKINGNATLDQNLSVAGAAEITGALNVTGTTNLGAGVLVTGDAQVSGAVSVDSANIATAATVGGDLVVNGNLDVKGTTTTVNTTEMEISDNIIRVNKYAPQDTPKQINGGLEVFRGGTQPEAQILWDEASGKWMAGKAGSLAEIPVGPLSVDGSGNVGIGTATSPANLDVRGEIKAKSFGFQVYEVGNVAARTLSNANNWQLFPDLYQEITLTHPAMVMVYSHITVVSNNTHILTRIVVDGNIKVKSIIGEVYYANTTNFWTGYLPAGNHTFATEYRSPGTQGINPFDDWQNYLMQVVVFGS